MIQQQNMYRFRSAGIGVAVRLNDVANAFYSVRHEDLDEWYSLTSDEKERAFF